MTYLYRYSGRVNVIGIVYLYFTRGFIHFYNFMQTKCTDFVHNRLMDIPSFSAISFILWKIIVFSQSSEEIRLKISANKNFLEESDICTIYEVFSEIWIRHSDVGPFHIFYRFSLNCTDLCSKCIHLIKHNLIEKKNTKTVKLWISPGQAMGFPLWTRGGGVVGQSHEKSGHEVLKVLNVLFPPVDSDVNKHCVRVFIYYVIMLVWLTWQLL